MSDDLKEKRDRALRWVGIDSLLPDPFRISGECLLNDKSRIQITDVPRISKRWCQTKHPTEERPLRVGDILEVKLCDGVDGKQFARFRGYDGVEYNIGEYVFKVVEEAGDVAPTSHPCTCSMNTLMADGCQCGGV